RRSFMYTIDFIGDDINRLAEGMQRLTNLSIGTNHTGTSINDENDDIGFMNGGMRLFRHIVINVAAAIVSFANTASVDYDKGFVFISRITVLTVTSQP